MSSPIFWQDLLDNLCLIAKEDGLLDNLNQMSSEEEMVQLFLSGKYRGKLLNWIRSFYKTSSWSKCEEKSRRLREEGNVYFKEKKFSQSVDYYCESLKYAKQKSEEFAFSVANRAAVSIQTGHFEDALRDIDLAIEHGYPEASLYKLYHRKGNCLMQLKKYEKARVALKHAQENLKLVCKESKSGQENTQFITKRIEKLLEDIANKQQDSNYVCGHHEKPTLPEPEGGESKEFPFASKLLGLQKDEDKGRYVTAIDDVSVGDVLFVEKPYAYVLLPEHYRERCHHCCNVFRSPIPCWKCSLVLYCCEECRLQSWNEYHQWECNGGLAVVDSVGIAHLGLRIVLIAGSIESHKHFKENLSNEVNYMDRYSAVYHLVSNLETMPVYDRAAYALTAACLALYLESFTNYFIGNSHEVPSSSSVVNKADVVLIGGLIMRHICQLVCNGHAITAVEEKSVGDKPPRSVKDVHQFRIATAIYPSASMMNHSCDPNIINSFLGTTIIIKAYKDIKKGEEVCNCYGPNYRTSSWQERREALKAQYHFECFCTECASRSDFDEQFTSILCPFCNRPVKERDIMSDKKCLHCGASDVHKNIFPLISKCKEFYDEGCKLLEQGHLVDALKCLKSCLSLQKKCLHRNHKHRSMVLDSIAKCLAMMGDYESSILYLQKTFPAVEVQYGSWSIEMAHELQKLSDLMICDLEYNMYDRHSFLLKYEDAIEVIQKAKDIFKLHYGPWNSSLRSTVEKENKLNEMVAVLNL